MSTTFLLVLAFATTAVSLNVGGMPDDTKVPMEGEYSAALEEASRKHRTTAKGGVARTVRETGTLRMDGDVEEELIEVTEKVAGCKWMFAVMPPLVLVAFVMLIRRAAEKAKQEDATNSWFSSFLRCPLIQQALAVAGPENESEQPELGESLLNKAEEDAEGGSCPDDEATAASPLLQPIKEEELEEEDASAKLFASLADSLYEEEDEEEEVQVLLADDEVPNLVQHVGPVVDDSEWDAFQC